MIDHQNLQLSLIAMIVIFQVQLVMFTEENFISKHNVNMRKSMPIKEEGLEILGR